MNEVNFKEYSLQEKKEFIITVLDQIKGDSKELNEIHTYFLMNEDITEEECDEVFAGLEAERTK